jgi:ribose transport system ATP-binding protein
MSFDTPLVLRGPLRAPRQMLADQAYGGHASLHDDEMARSLGFRAGPIEGPTHFSQFDPLLTRIWGRAWFEHGCLSAHYLNMVIEGEEVRAFADRVTVIRDGATVGGGAVGSLSDAQIVEWMVGRAVTELYPRSPRTAGAAVLEISGVAGRRLPESASLVLHRGEVLGIAGLVGAGRTELVRAVFGLDPVRRGTVRVAAETGAASPARRWAQGVGMVSEDRKAEGLAVNLSIADNLTLSRLDGLGPAGLVLSGRQAAASRRWIEPLQIKCRDVSQPVAALSGGNQQKVAVARLLHHDVDVLLLDEPTRGIDVGAKARIYALIDELATQGRAILLVSSHVPELLGVCDRVAVMCRGRLGPARPVDEIDEHSLMQEAIGHG